jgi:hypothetical protein
MWRWVDGSESGNASFTVSGVTTNGIFARIHQLSGVGGKPGIPRLESAGLTQATTTTVSQTAVTTTELDELAIWFDAHADDSGTTHTIGGASGGTWVERTEDASSVGGDGRICFTTAAMATPGTISGGTGTTVGTIRWISRTFALMGEQFPPPRKLFPQLVAH